MHTYKNPIIYADYSDPDVIRVGEDYYMVASSFTYLPGVPLLHSKDLVHWELINYCVLSLPFEKYTFPSHGSGTWAPSIRYRNGMFIVFIPLVDEGILVARSVNPYGSFELNMLCLQKGWIDPCPFWDEDGKTYMVFAYAGSRTGIKHRLMMVEIDEDCRKILKAPQTIFDGEQVAPTTEGPKMYKKDGYYYILMPSGGVETGWQSCLRSRSVYGPYEYKVVMRQGTSSVNGPHQGGWVTALDGRDWFIHFQDVVELGRITHLQPMCFVDGWPFIGQDKDGDGIGEPVDEWRVPVEGKPEYGILTSDDFTADTLGLQWQWQANPDCHNYSLTENPGHLRLFCRSNPQRENLMWYAPNVLTQIPQSKTCSMTVKLKLQGKAKGDFGGIGILGHKYGYMGLYFKNPGMEIRCYEGDVTDKMFLGAACEACVQTMEIDDDEVWFRVVIEEGRTYHFLYSLDGRAYSELGTSYPLYRATWTGAKLCLWTCARENEEAGGYCDYEYVVVERDRV